MATDVTENQLSEILQLLQRLVSKAGDHDQRFDSVDRRFDRLDEKLEVLNAEFSIVDGKVSDIAVKLMQIDKRLAVVEAKLNLTETKLTSLDDEARQIRLEMNDLNEGSATVKDIRDQVEQLQVRVFQLEEKLAN